MSKNLYIIAGCNGAGKTTASFTILPEILNCREFVNADEIARGLSPFQPEKTAIEAGKIMLYRIELQTVELAKKRVQERVLDGGHNIDSITIERRYLRGIRNLFEIYLPIADRVLIFDNSGGKYELIATKINKIGISILNNNKYNLLKNIYDSKEKK